VVKFWGRLAARQEVEYQIHELQSIILPIACGRKEIVLFVISGRKEKGRHVIAEIRFFKCVVLFL
jgi:hypothetical protein